MEVLASNIKTMNIEDMNDEDFARLFALLPARTQLMIRGGLVDWRETCQKWLDYHAHYVDDMDVSSETRDMLVRHYNASPVA